MTLYRKLLIESNEEKTVIVLDNEAIINSFPEATEINIEAAQRRRLSEVKLTLAGPDTILEKKSNNKECIIHLPLQLSKINSVSLILNYF